MNDFQMISRKGRRLDPSIREKARYFYMNRKRSQLISSRMLAAHLDISFGTINKWIRKDHGYNLLGSKKFHTFPESVRKRARNWYLNPILGPKTPSTKIAKLLGVSAPQMSIWRKIDGGYPFRIKKKLVSQPNSDLLKKWERPQQGELEDA